jgi:hypothetical protein
MGRKRKDGTAAQRKDHDADVRTYEEFTSCTHVQGGTLRRFCLDEDLSVPLEKGVHWMWIYTPPPRSLGIHCDGCVRQHRPSNLACSATRRAETPFVDPRVLYDFETRAPAMLIETIGVQTDGRIEGCLVTERRTVRSSSVVYESV